MEEIKEECRICLSEDPIGDLISPCDCSGTLKRVHKSCLKEWIKTQTENRTEEECLTCELCKKRFRYIKMCHKGCKVSVYLKGLLKTVWHNLGTTTMLGLCCWLHETYADDCDKLRKGTALFTEVGGSTQGLRRKLMISTYTVMALVTVGICVGLSKMLVGSFFQIIVASKELVFCEELEHDS